MPQRIQLRRGTASEWVLADPILASGEPGAETDTGRSKVGDGLTRWVLLPYVAPKITVSPTPPPDPLVNDIWVDTSS